MAAGDELKAFQRYVDVWCHGCRAVRTLLVIGHRRHLLESLRNGVASCPICESKEDNGEA